MTDEVAHDGGDSQRGTTPSATRSTRPRAWTSGNWTVPADGEYPLRVRVEPPTFMRHDEVNGRRFTEPVDVEFRGVKVERGQD